MYPKFKEIVQNVAGNEINIQKEKAEEYLDIQIELHKRFINCEHVEFSKMNQFLRKSKKVFQKKKNTWFKEKISAVEEKKEDDSDDHLSNNGSVDIVVDSVVDVVAIAGAAALPAPAGPIVGSVMKKVGAPVAKKVKDAMFGSNKHGKLGQMQFGESQESLLHLEEETEKQTRL